MLYQETTEENPDYQEMQLQILPDPVNNKPWMSSHPDTPPVCSVVLSFRAGNTTKEHKQFQSYTVSCWICFPD